MSEDRNEPRAPHAQSSHDSIRDDRAPESADDSSLPAEPDDSDAGAQPPKEYGGRKGPNPVRYGDWEKNGRCIDF